MKTKLLALYTSILDTGIEEIEKHLDDEEHQSLTELGKKLGTRFDCDDLLCHSIIKSYIEARGDIECVRGRNGGVRRKVVLTASIVEDIEKAVEAIVEEEAHKTDPTPSIIEEVKTVEAPKEVKVIEPPKKEERKVDVFDENEPDKLPSWITAEKDPMQKKFDNSGKIWK